MSEMRNFRHPASIFQPIDVLLPVDVNLNLNQISKIYGFILSMITITLVISLFRIIFRKFAGMNKKFLQ